MKNPDLVTTAPLPAITMAEVTDGSHARCTILLMLRLAVERDRLEHEFKKTAKEHNGKAT